MDEIIVVSGFSGAGKGTLLNAFLKSTDNAEVIRSCTTRPRRNELDNYTFVLKDTFKRMYENNEFLEVAEYNGHYYGTPEREVRIALGKGKTVILEIDITGLKQVLRYVRAFPWISVRSVFIAAQPRELMHRLFERGGETKQSVCNRLNAALQESKSLHLYDYIIVNENFDQALQDLREYIVDRSIPEGRGNFNINQFQKEMMQLIELLRY